MSTNVLGFYKASPTDSYLACFTQRGACYITLPLITTVQDGFTLIVADSGNNASINNIVLNTQDGSTVNNVSVFVINNNAAYVSLVKNGFTWTASGNFSAVASGSGTSVATGNITVAVSTSGSDTPTSNRPATVVSGNYAAYPFATIQGALNALPKVLNSNYCLVQIGIGSFAGYTVQGFCGGGTLVLQGSFATSAITGSSSGVAGTGTSTTIVSLPNGGTNWSNSSLRGHIFQINSGAGASTDSNVPTMRPINSNTTNTLTVYSVPGMNNTTSFSIVNVATTLTACPSSPISGKATCANYIENTVLVKTLGLNVAVTGDYGIYSTLNTRVEFTACPLTNTSSVGSFYSVNDSYCLFNDTFITNSAGITVLGAPNAEVQRLTNDAASILIQQCPNVLTVSDANGCTSTALQILQANYANVTLNANNCTTSPFVAQSILRMTNSGLTGATNTGYGCLFSKGGSYNCSGATLTGSLGDFQVDGFTDSWSDLAVSQAISGFGVNTVVVLG